MTLQEKDLLENRAQSGANKIAIAKPSLGQEEWLAMRESLESGWLTQGPKVKAFETAFAARHGVSHALATTSCTTALHLALVSLGIGPGDEVIVPAFTWVATANVVVYCGATPVFVDVQKNTYNLDPEKVRSTITSRTKAIIPVHLFGLCADMDALKEIVPPGVAIVEDAACAAGARYHGQSAGSLGDVGCFSFHPRKSITTGEGGMLTCNDASLAERAEVLRNHGASVCKEARDKGPAPHVLADFNVLGFNYRMTDLQAAVGLVQLEKLATFVAERSEKAKEYIAKLSRISWLKMPEVPRGYDHAWQSFVTVVDQQTSPMPRNEIMARLQEQGISTRPGTHAVSELGYYRKRYSLATAQFPIASRLQEESMALPLHNQMSDADYQRVVDALLAIDRVGYRRS